jgi:predicted RNase H-like nuclease
LIFQITSNWNLVSKLSRFLKQFLFRSHPRTRKQLRGSRPWRCFATFQNNQKKALHIWATE